MQERRHFIRWQVDKEIRIEIKKQNTCMECQIKDISFKGVQISLAERLEKDAYFILSINLSYDCNLNVEVWVAWHKTIDSHNLYGLYFNKVKDLDKEKIYYFVRSNFPEQLNEQWWQAPLEIAEPKYKTRFLRGQGLGAEKKEGGGEMEDKRIFDRFAAEFPLRFLDSTGNREGLGKTVDISAKGISLESEEELDVNAPLELWLNIPDRGEPLYARGEVIWSKMVGPNLYRAGVNLEKANFMGFSRIFRVD